jgi:hypothetical protein
MLAEQLPMIQRGLLAKSTTLSFQRTVHICTNTPSNGKLYIFYKIYASPPLFCQPRELGVGFMLPSKLLLLLYGICIICHLTPFQPSPEK